MRVVAAAGRDPARARAAVGALAGGLGHEVEARDGLLDLLSPGDLDVLIVAAPVAAHLAALRAGLDAGVHVLCEKPLVRLGEESQLASWPTGFVAAGRLLTENCQWPQTLGAFDALHPGARQSTPVRFDMRMSPSGVGFAMVEDSLSTTSACCRRSPRSTKRRGSSDASGRPAPATRTSSPSSSRSRAPFPELRGRFELIRTREPAAARVVRDRREGDSSGACGCRATRCSRATGGARSRWMIRSAASCMVFAMASDGRLEPESAAKSIEPASVPGSSPQSPRDGEHRRAEKVHDFTSKLRQPGLWPHVARYVAWQRELRRARRDGERDPAMPDVVPLSINLDLTTACNYALRSLHRLGHPQQAGSPTDDDEAASDLARRHDSRARLKSSVILIGGVASPPLLSGASREMVAWFLKELDLQVAVVTQREPQRARSSMIVPTVSTPTTGCA